MFCPNCGKQITEDSAFCAYCGRNVISSVQPQNQRENLDKGQNQWQNQNLDQGQSQYQGQNNVNQNVNAGNNAYAQNNFVKAYPKPKYVPAPANFKSTKYNPLFIVFAAVCGVSIVVLIVQLLNSFVVLSGSDPFLGVNKVLYWIDLIISPVTEISVNPWWMFYWIVQPNLSGTFEIFCLDVIPQQVLGLSICVFLLFVDMICFQKKSYVKALTFAKVVLIIFLCMCAINIVLYLIYYFVWHHYDYYAYGIDWIIRDVLKWIAQAGSLALYILMVRAVIKLDKAYKFSLANFQR